MLPGARFLWREGFPSRRAQAGRFTPCEPSSGTKPGERIMSVADSSTLRGDAGALGREGSDHSKVLFWGCFIALVTTAFGFITRMFLEDTFRTAFNLDQAQTGRLLGIGIWPFAASIIFFSLVIDKIGYKVSMMIAFAGHIIWAVMGYMAYSSTKNGDPETGYRLVYWGSLIL